MLSPRDSHALEVLKEERTLRSAPFRQRSTRFTGWTRRQGLGPHGQRRIADPDALNLRSPDADGEESLSSRRSRRVEEATDPDVVDVDVLDVHRVVGDTRCRAILNRYQCRVVGTGGRVAK